MTRQPVTIGIAAAVFGIAVQAISAQTVNVVFEKDGNLVPVARPVSPNVTPAEAAIYSLVNGPTADEIAQGYVSSIPATVFVVSLAVEGNTVTIDLSPEILVDLSEGSLLAIFNQFRATLGESPSITTIRLTCRDQLLSSYLEPVVVRLPAAPDRMAVEAGPTEPAPMGLAGRNITIGPSHGRFWNGTGWYWMRTDPCGFGEAVLEDTNSIRLMQFLHYYLTQDGATVNVHRSLDETPCCHPAEGLHWWKLATYAWLRNIGLPCSIYASLTGECDSDVGSNRSSDDIRARALFADYMGSEIYISHHTNGAGGTGTETFRDSEMIHSEHEANSLSLATAVNNGIVDSIRNMYDANWTNRGVKDSAGGFGEIRVPDQPAILIELAFHDRCDKDALYLMDNFFRSVSEWGVYKGVCEYFGTTPTWDKYSCEYVSDTIPSTMDAATTYPVSITFRNRGVTWTDAHGFRLGAEGDSDPFASFTRVAVPGEVGPGDMCTFNFTLRAPGLPGTYNTEWRMVRDNHAWFGPTHSEPIVVNPGPVFDDALLVDEDIPTELAPGQTTEVHLTFRNFGTTTWTTENGFKLGAMGDTDPFSATPQELGIGVSVLPDSEHTFTFTFTAPLTAGTYTTDWQMIHEGTGWFGEILSEEVNVAYPPVTVLFDSFDFYGGQTWLEVVWIDTGNSAYLLEEVFGNGGKSIRMPSPAYNYLGRYYRNLDRSYDPTDAEPLEFAFDFYLADSGSPDWEGARHFCEIRGHSGGSYNNGTLQNLLAIGVNNTSGDTFSTTRYQGRVMNGVNWITLDEGSAPNRMTGWHQMKIRVTTNEVLFYVDGILCETEARPNAYGFDSVVIGSDLTANGHTAYVDNVEVGWHHIQPVLVEHPAPQQICPGETAQFSVSAYSGAISYHWQKDEVDLTDGGHYSGVLTDTLTISGVDATDAGSYRCMVSNEYNGIPSNNAALTLRAQTVVTIQPQPQHVNRGGTAVFNTSGGGDGTPSFQWQKNEEDMPGEESTTLILTNCGYDDVAEYRCVITAGCGSVYTNTAALTLPARTDIDQDNDVDLADFGTFQYCFNGPNRPLREPSCDVCDFDEDNDVDLADFGMFAACFNGPNRPPACH